MFTYNDSSLFDKYIYSIHCGTLISLTLPISSFLERPWDILLLNAVLIPGANYDAPSQLFREG